MIRINSESRTHELVVSRAEEIYSFMIGSNVWEFGRCRIKSLDSEDGIKKNDLTTEKNDTASLLEVTND
jgi:hypothetical protein